MAFQSTLPARGATRKQAEKANGWEFQSTLPARGATRYSCVFLLRFTFQSTLPARGATKSRHTATFSAKNFNPRSLHGERRADNLPGLQRSNISIHAPCTGSDQGDFARTGDSFSFQSTLPARGATDARRNQAAKRRISIHAPCTGSDTRSDASPIDSLIISIHAPCTGSDYRRYRCTSSS